MTTGCATRMLAPSLRPLWPLVLLAALLLAASPLFGAEREVRVGVYANEPKLMLSPDGRLSGIFGELLQALAEREGWRLRPVPCEWQQCLELAGSGAIELLPDVAWNEERADYLDFHQTPALFSWSQLYAPRERRLNSILDLQGRRI